MKQIAISIEALAYWKQMLNQHVDLKTLNYNGSLYKTVPENDKNTSRSEGMIVDTTTTTNNNNNFLFYPALHFSLTC